MVHIMCTILVVHLMVVISVIVVLTKNKVQGAKQNRCRKLGVLPKFQSKTELYKNTSRS